MPNRYISLGVPQEIQATDNLNSVHLLLSQTNFYSVFVFLGGKSRDLEIVIDFSLCFSCCILLATESCKRKSPESPDGQSLL